MRDSSGTRALYSRCSVSGVWAKVSGWAGGMGDQTYAFWALVVLLGYPPHPLEFRAHVVAAADKLDRVAEPHLAVRVHQPLLLQLLAPAGLRVL